MIRKYPYTVANHREMLEAGEKLVEYMDICQDDPEAPPDAALDAPHSFFFFGNPSWYATWRDEGHSRDLKRVLRNCHQRFLEERAFMKLGSVLDRSKHRRLK